MKHILCILFLGIYLFAFGMETTAQTEITVSNKELALLIGKWQGQLTYLDYTSNKPYSMPAKLQVSQRLQSNDYLFQQIYPNETSANTVDTFFVSQNGRFINGEKVIKKQYLANGTLLFITELMGIDGNNKEEALIQHTYMLNKKIFSIKKQVRFLKDKSWIMRHQYAYKRI